MSGMIPTSSVLFGLLTVTLLVLCGIQRRSIVLRDFAGPQYLPFVGSLMALKGRLIVEACEEQQWRRLYGPVVRFFVGQRPCLLITTG